MKKGIENALQSDILLTTKLFTFMLNNAGEYFAIVIGSLLFDYFN